MANSQKPQGGKNILIVIILIIVVVVFYNSRKKQSNVIRDNFPTYTRSTGSAYSDDAERQRHDGVMQDLSRDDYQTKRREAIRNGDDPDLVSK
jgi:uncharacterized protein YxeA